MKFEIDEKEIDLEDDTFAQDLIPTDDVLAELSVDMPAEVVEETKVEDLLVEGVHDIQQAEDDFVKIRQNLQKVVQIGMDGLKGCHNLTNAVDEPRAYDSLSKMVKSVTDASKQLLEIHSMRKDLKKRDGKIDDDVPTNVQNTVVFTGTTKELLEKFCK